MIVESKITGKKYDTRNVCRIVNMMQLASYLDYGVELLDLYPSRDIKTNKPVIVGIVDRTDSYEAYQLWCRHELN